MHVSVSSDCMYLSVSSCICLYMTESTCITRLYTVQINSLIASTPVSRVVRGPNHGPRVDVEQLAARSRRKSDVQTHSLDKTSKYNINMYKYTHIQTYTYTYAHSYLAIFLSINQKYMHIRAYTCRYRHIHTNMRTSLSIFACIKTVLVFIKTVLNRLGLARVGLCKFRSHADTGSHLKHGH